MSNWDLEMQRALEADGEKLRQLTGEDHGPYFAAGAQHTPGPWQVGGVRQSITDFKGHAVGPDGDPVVIVPYNDKQHAECIANARLIAAAPDLLASCIEFLPILERQLKSMNPGGAADGSIAFQTATARVERMRAALSKVQP